MGGLSSRAQPKEFCSFVRLKSHPQRSKQLFTGILMLGLDALLETAPTLSFNRATTTYGDHRIMLWEVDLWNGHAFMFVVDATALHRLEEARTELHGLQTELEQWEYGPLLVVASKMDRHSDTVLAEISNALGLNQSNTPLMGVSSLTNFGVEEMMQWFIADVSKSQIDRRRRDGGT
ncbi:hypothetical protein FB45DRAFT_921686 [Roridomyces roridus]|uniref:ADP-ribosylation factor n=1 Tax=Roridomyces roridus TaxID=1738132 RepID=A0AAD7BMN2_9AGAR|nr:hypothetical protein FB45DRAFT_921686 [Roridomyces roridus]